MLRINSLLEDNPTEEPEGPVVGGHLVLFASLMNIIADSSIGTAW